jgi:hypothetical protein
MPEQQFMGLAYAELELANLGDVHAEKHGLIKLEQVRRMKANFLADTGTVVLAINEDIQMQLGASQVEERLAELADGSVRNLPVVGPMEVRFGNRRGFFYGDGAAPQFRAIAGGDSDGGPGSDRRA